MATMLFPGATTLEYVLLAAPPFAYTLAYVPMARASVSFNKDLTLRVHNCRLIHNILMAVFSGVMTVAAIAHLASRPMTVYGQLCMPSSSAPLMVLAWYLSKFWEWFDSALLLAQGKELGSLHYNHHATTATVVASHFIGRGGTLFASRTSIFDWPLLLNAGVLFTAAIIEPARLSYPCRSSLQSAR